MNGSDWGSWEWNEEHFPKDQLDTTGDTWGFRWRGVEKMRHQSYLDLIDGTLHQSHPIHVLDIGCALCDITGKTWNLNRNNMISGMDVSRNLAWMQSLRPDRMTVTDQFRF